MASFAAANQERWWGGVLLVLNGAAHAGLGWDGLLFTLLLGQHKTYHFLCDWVLDQTNTKSSRLVGNL